MTEFDHDSIELSSIIWNDDASQTKHEHESLPIKMVDHFYYDIGDDYNFYPLCEIV